MKRWLFLIMCVCEYAAYAQMPYSHYKGGAAALVDLQARRPLTPYKYTDIGVFAQGRAVASWRSAGKMFYTHLDEKGRELISPTENQLFPLVQGRIIYRDKQTKLFGYLDSLGAVRVQARFKRCANYSEGLAYVELPNGTPERAFIDLEGKTVFEIPTGYGLYDEHFTQGIIRVEMPPKRTGEPAKRELWGKMGQVVLNLEEFGRGSRCETVLPKGFITYYVNEDGKVMRGVLSKGGKWIIKPENCHITPVEGGFLMNRRVIESGIFDSLGANIVPVQYRTLFAMHGGWLAGNYLDKEREKGDRLYTYFDRAGKPFPQSFIDAWAMPNGDLWACLPQDTAKSQKTYHLYAPDGTLKKSALIGGFYEATSEQSEDFRELRAFVTVLWGKQWALASTTDKQIYSDWCDEIAPFLSAEKPEWVAMRQGKAWTLVGKTWEYAHSFEGDFSAVKRGKWAIIHRSGNLTTELKYDSIAPLVRSADHFQRVQYMSGIENAPALEHGHREVTPLAWSEMPHGYFLACQNKKWGVIDAFGEVILPFFYDVVEEANHEYIQATAGGKRFWVDYHNRPIAAPPPQYIHLPGYILNGSLCVRTPAGTKLFNQSYPAGTAAYDTLMLFEERVENFLVRKGGKYGLLSSNGSEALALQYDSLYPIEHNLPQEDFGLIGVNPRAKEYVLLQKNGKFGLAYHYKEVLACEYSRITPDIYFAWFVLQRADNKKYGLCDKAGKELLPPVYEKITMLNKTANSLEVETVKDGKRERKTLPY